MKTNIRAKDSIDVEKITYTILKKQPKHAKPEELIKAAIIGVCGATKLFLQDQEIAEIVKLSLKPQVKGQTGEALSIVEKIDHSMLVAMLQTKVDLARMRTGN